MRTILIIEDDTVTCRLLEKILTRQGYSVIHAHRGWMGLEMLTAYQPDLVLCDVMLPDLLGWDVVTQVRSNSSMSGVPFIFLTGLDDPKDQRKGMKLGADDYLTKPIDQEELVNTIEACLRKNELITRPYVEEMKRVNESLQNVLYYDYLTSLPNQLGLKHMLGQQLLLPPDDPKKPNAILILRLDDMQSIIALFIIIRSNNSSEQTNFAHRFQIPCQKLSKWLHLTFHMFALPTFAVCF